MHDARHAARNGAAKAHGHRPPLVRELVLVAATYGLYTLTRNTLPEHTQLARANARGLYDVERHLHIDVERWANSLFADHAPRALAVTANYTYALSHLAVTLGVLVWLYVARPGIYRPARTVLLLTTVSGLVGYWLYPLAPPRFFPRLGFVDTVVHDGTWGGWGSSAMASMSNQYAAMPSMHVAWSLWVAGVLLLSSRRRVISVAAAAYPLIIGFVILGTANHWLLDVAGGAGAVGVAVLLRAAASRLGSSRDHRVGAVTARNEVPQWTSSTSWSSVPDRPVRTPPDEPPITASPSRSSSRS